MNAEHRDPSSRPLARPALERVAVVPMGHRHLPAVLAIERSVYPRPWSPALFASEIARPGRRYVVGLAPGGRWLALRRLVGYAGIAVDGRRGHVTTVAVHPAHHRRKVASRLLVALLRAAVASGADSVILEVRADNRGAQRLYTGFGFAPVGIRPGYYAETGEDALVMYADDLQGADFAGRLDAQQARLDEPGGSSGAPDIAVPWVRGRVGLGGAAAAAAGGSRRVG